MNNEISQKNRKLNAVLVNAGYFFVILPITAIWIFVGSNILSGNINSLANILFILSYFLVLYAAQRVFKYFLKRQINTSHVG